MQYHLLAMHTENVDDVNIMEYSSTYEYFCKRMAWKNGCPIESVHVETSKNPLHFTFKYS